MIVRLNIYATYYIQCHQTVYYTATAVIGFERTSYTGLEGEQIEICVTTFSGVNNLPNDLSVLIHFDYQEGGIIMMLLYI